MSGTTTWIVETTDATFEQDVLERSRKVPVVVDFWAEWCRPCHLLAPMLERLAARFAGRFVLVKANTDQTQAAASQFRVQGIPAVFGFRDGELSDSFVGVPPESQIELWIEQLLPTEAESFGRGQILRRFALTYGMSFAALLAEGLGAGIQENLSSGDTS